MTDEKFVFDSLQDCSSIKEFLASLTEGFEKGKITLSTNGDAIELNPQGLLSFMVKAKKKGTSSKLSIKVSWKDCSDATKTSDSSIKVS